MVSKSSNKIHQTWGPHFSPAPYFDILPECPRDDCFRPSVLEWRLPIQGSGNQIKVPAVANHCCLNLLAAFTKPGRSISNAPCTSWWWKNILHPLSPTRIHATLGTIHEGCLQNFRVFGPSPPCWNFELIYGSESPQPPLLCLLLDQPPPPLCGRLLCMVPQALSPTVGTSFMNGPLSSQASRANACIIIAASVAHCIVTRSKHAGIRYLKLKPRG